MTCFPFEFMLLLYAQGFQLTKTNRYRLVKFICDLSQLLTSSLNTLCLALINLYQQFCQILSGTKVCSEHFKPSEFKTTLTGRRVLRKGKVLLYFAGRGLLRKKKRKNRVQIKGNFNIHRLTVGGTSIDFSFVN